MNLSEIIIGNNDNSNYFFNKENRNPLNHPLDLIILKVFSYLTPLSLKQSSDVCKYWKQLTIEISLTSHSNALEGGNHHLSIANIENAQEIAEVVVTAFSKGDVFRKEGQRRTSKKEVIEDMHTPCNRWYVITIKTKIVAAMLYISDSKEDASIHMLSSHPDYWGQKLGILLMEKAETVAKQQGKTNLNLSAAHTNERLIGYYEKLGFKKTENCEEVEYFSPEFQKEYLIPEYQGYEADGKAKLRNYDMTKLLQYTF